MAEAVKSEQASQLQAALDDVLNLHRQEFPKVTAPIAPVPAAINRRIVHSAHRRSAGGGTGVLRVGEWKRRRSATRAAVSREIEQLESECEHLRRLHQQELDQWWNALTSNTLDVLLPALNAAFTDNEAPARAVDVACGEVVLVTLVPGLDLMPERKPDRTPKGNLTLKKLTKSERGALHMSAAASHMLLTVREAFAVGRGVTAAKVIAVQNFGLDAWRRPRIEPVLAARFSRVDLDRVDWQRAGALDILRDAGMDQVANVRRAANELRPIELNEPYSDVLNRISLEELMYRA